VADQPLEPNTIADTYEALTQLHDLVARLADAREAATGEADSILHTYASIIGDRRATFGDATRVRNPFSMDAYRAAFGDTLPTIQTAGLSDEERRLLCLIGIVDADETFRLPCDPWDGQRMPLDPSGGLNIEYDMLHALELPDPALTILHVSDTRLGYEHRAAPGGNATTTWVDRTDSVAAFEAVVDRAIETDVDVVVHTGDLFDHDVDHQTLDAAVTGLRRLNSNDVPFYFILGDHDRLATGQSLRTANAMETLATLADDGTVVHGSPRGSRLVNTPATLYGVDATGVGFTDIETGYTLDDWTVDAVAFDPQTAGSLTLLCLHDVTESGSLTKLLDSVRTQGLAPDLVCCGDAHSPPFGDDWQTTIDGVQVSRAGPTIPVSSYFDDHTPATTLITVDDAGGVELRRDALSLAPAG
jgi:hypothetical protein